MKKTFLALIGLLIASAANAGGGQTFCIDFVNFCDGVEVSVTGDGTTANWANNDCLGASAPLLTFPGDAGINMACLDTGVCPVGLQFLFSFTFDTSTFNLFGFDGVAPTVFQTNQPFAILPGACNFAASPSGLSPSTAR